MCYAIKTASLPGIRLPADALPAKTAGGFHFAKDTVPVFLHGGEMRLMRWDLIPRGFLRNDPSTLAPTLYDVIRKKNSRAINPETGKSGGFSSYNARIETVDSLWTFKDAWRDGNRGLIPVVGFRERPNMDGAPAEARGKEYEISLDQRYYLAALYDTWKSKDGEALESCTVITGPSDDVAALQAIWHERVPILLSTEAARAWLDPATNSRVAMELLRGVPVPTMRAHEVVPVAKPAKGKAPDKKVEKQAGANGVSLDLFGSDVPS